MGNFISEMRNIPNYEPYFLKLIKKNIVKPKKRWKGKKQSLDIRIRGLTEYAGRKRFNVMNIGINPLF